VLCVLFRYLAADLELTFAGTLNSCPALSLDSKQVMDIVSFSMEDRTLPPGFFILHRDTLFLCVGFTFPSLSDSVPGAMASGY